MAAVGLWLYLRTANPVLDGKVSLAGLQGPVEVLRDEYGIPSIFAANERDLYRAIGYIHAQERLWQMDLYHRIAEGRMAELFGSAQVETDRFLRTVGIARAAEQEESLLGAQERLLLQAYADGVNAWLTKPPRALPPEFLILRAKPQPWTVLASLEVAKLMAWDLTSWQSELSHQALAARVSPALMKEVENSLLQPGPIILEGFAEWQTKPALPVHGLAPHRTPNEPSLMPDGALRLLGLASLARASNAWIVDGRYTASKKPMLANDMHLALQLPSQWFLVGLHGGSINAVGMTLPGLPMIIVGNTARVAWGLTSSMVDDLDFFIEKLDPQSPDRYVTAEGSRPLEIRTEQITVHSGAPVTVKVRSTHRGPLLSDVLPGSSNQLLSLRWTGQDPAQSIAALMKMNRAESAAELIAASKGFGGPPLVLLATDAAGDIQVKLIGNVPVRGQGDGSVPMPGWLLGADWQRMLSFDEQIGGKQPPGGHVISANNQIVGSEYPYLLTRSYGNPYRAQRIAQLLEGRTNLTAADFAAQQLDVKDLLALRYLPHAVRAARDAKRMNEAALLSSWDGQARSDSVAASLFYTWQLELRQRLAQDELGERATKIPLCLVSAVLDAGNSPWVDDTRTPQRETLEELERAAMIQAVQQVRGRPWGDALTMHVDHVLGSVPVLDKLLGLNLAPQRGIGSHDTVNMAYFTGDQPPFHSSYGATQRYVADLGNLDDGGGFALPSGQSGVPFSPHYRDQVSLWQKGKLLPIPLDRQKATQRAVHRQSLLPPAAQ